MSNPRRRDSVKARRICFDTHRQYDALGHFMICHVCGGRIDAVRKPNDWTADHYPVRWSEGGEDTAENLHPLCVVCAEKKDPDDTREIAHGKRMGNKHFGLERRKPWR